MSHSVVVSALHSGWENPSSSHPIDFALGWQLLAVAIVLWNILTQPSLRHPGCEEGDL